MWIKMRFPTGTKKYRLLVIDCPPHKVPDVERKLKLFESIGTIIHDEFRIKFSVDVTDLTEEAADSRLQDIKVAVKMVLGYSAVSRLD